MVDRFHNCSISVKLSSFSKLLYEDCLGTHRVRSPNIIRNITTQSGWHFGNYWFFKFARYLLWCTVCFLRYYHAALVRFETKFQYLFNISHENPNILTGQPKNFRRFFWNPRCNGPEIRAAMLLQGSIMSLMYSHAALLRFEENFKIFHTLHEILFFTTWSQNILRKSAK